LTRQNHQAGAAGWVVACRDEHLRQVGAADIWSAMQAAGVGAVEAVVDFDRTCPGLFRPDGRYSIAEMHDLLALQSDLRRHDLRISAFCLLNRFDERLEEEIEFVSDVVHAAVLLGVPAIRVDFLPHRLRDRQEEFLPLAIGAGRRLAEAVGNMPVRLGVENHVTTTNRTEFLRAFFDGVASDRIGLTLDAANFYWFGHPLSEVYRICEEFAGRVCHTHCKNIAYPPDRREAQRPMGWEYARHACPVDEGDIDFRRIADLLRRAGYAGDLCLENECLSRFPTDQRLDVLRREIAFLERLAAG